MHLVQNVPHGGTGNMCVYQGGWECKNNISYHPGNNMCNLLLLEKYTITVFFLCIINKFDSHISSLHLKGEPSLCSASSPGFSYGSLNKCQVFNSNSDQDLSLSLACIHPICSKTTTMYIYAASSAQLSNYHA